MSPINKNSLAYNISLLDMDLHVDCDLNGRFWLYHFGQIHTDFTGMQALTVTLPVYISIVVTYDTYDGMEWPQLYW